MHRKQLEAANRLKPQARTAHIETLDPLTLKTKALAKSGAVAAGQSKS